MNISEIFVEAEQDGLPKQWDELKVVLGGRSLPLPDMPDFKLINWVNTGLGLVAMCDRIGWTDEVRAEIVSVMNKIESIKNGNTEINS